MNSSHLGRVGWAVVVTSTVIATTLGTSAMATAVDRGPTDPGPAKTSSDGPAVLKSKLRGLERSARGRQTVFVQLSGAGSADVAQANPVDSTDKSEVKARRAAVARQSNAVLTTARNEDARAARLFTTSNAIPGVAIRLDQGGIEAVAARSDVVKVSRISPKHLTNANTAALTKAYDTWKYTGNLGEGVKIGVIDSGIDYTHKDFGGPGTVAAYDAAKAESASPGWRAGLPALAQAKVVGGYDLVGDDYYPDELTEDGSENPDFNPVATPDDNPLDCEGHGTHVSGTAAGYGVTAAGDTFTGDYGSLTKPGLLGMRVGPGMAPAASIYALKVFGCRGTTTYDLAALDRALDPNQDGDFSDHLDIVNLSLGSDDTPVDDPENAMIDELTRHGVLTVTSAGNNGDLTDTGGVPSNAESGLSVASSVDAYQLRDGLKVDAPSNVAGISPGQVSDAYDWAANGPTGKPVSGTVVTIPGADADGCDPLAATDTAKVKGKVAWLEWDDDDNTRRCGSVQRSENVAKAGAIGAIFTSSLDVFEGLISGSDAIPVFQLTKASTQKLRAAAAAGTLKATFDGKYRATIKDVDTSLDDLLAGYSSRGVHGSMGVVKPDVTAPGDTIASAGVGQGSGPLVLSGTSMSAPLAAGVSAQVRSRHPHWSPLLVKAAVMNTATHDLWTGRNTSGLRYGPNRVGAGRLDALAAVSTPVLAFSRGKNNPVTAAFGVVPAPVDQAVTTKTLPLKVVNKSKRAATYRLSYEPVVKQPGVSYTVSPSSLTLAAKTRGSATVTMRVTTAELRHTIDPTMEQTQQGEARQYVSDASGRVLVTPAGEDAVRVPVYGAAKPVSVTRASAVANRIALSGRGFSQGSGSTAWKSFASVMELGATSGTLSACEPDQTSGCADTETERSGDLQYVGAGSTGKLLWFGLSTYANWAKIGTNVVPYVDFDTNADGQPDYETYATYLPGTDVMVAETYDLNDPDFATVDVQPVNFNYGDVDTNVFDTNVLTLPVSRKLVGLNNGRAPITYTVGTYDPLVGEDIDDSDEVSFDVGKPAVRTAKPLYDDQGGTSIDYSRSGSPAPVKALVLHLHGADQRRAEVLTLPREAPTYPPVR